MEGLAAIHAYESLRQRFRAQENEWTVLAAVVASGSSLLPDPRGTVISLANGNKCLGPEKVSDQGLTLNDCHAEVLCVRALRAFLMNELQTIGAKGYDAVKSRCLLEPVGEDRFCLKNDVKLHLFVSELPCGDCSIVAERDGSFRYSGAKPFDQPTTREDHQELCILRRKSGRHDLDPSKRSLSTSCSDKINRWIFVGLEGSFLSKFLEPVRFRSLTLSLDCLHPGASTREKSRQTTQSILVDAKTTADRQTDGLLLAWSLFGKQDVCVDEAMAQVFDNGAATARDCILAGLRGSAGRLTGHLLSSDPFSVRLSVACFPHSQRRLDHSLDPQQNQDEGRGAMKEKMQKKRKRAFAASGISVQWIWVPEYHLQVVGALNGKPRTLESVQLVNRRTLLGIADVINQATGQLAGKVVSNPLEKMQKRSANEVHEPSSSRLELLPNVAVTCRASMFWHFMKLYSRFHPNGEPAPPEYCNAKTFSEHPQRTVRRRAFLDIPAFSLWQRKDKSSFSNFQVLERRTDCSVDCFCDSDTVIKKKEENDNEGKKK